MISKYMSKRIYNPLPEPHIQNELIIKLIKVLDIFFASFVYICAAFLVSLILDKYFFPKFNEEKEKKKKFIISVFEVCFIVGLIGVISYVIRNLIQMIPFPLDGLYGFKHLMVGEVRSGALFSAYVILLNSYLQKKLIVIKNKFSNIVNKK
jgi:hypothetical protein